MEGRDKKRVIKKAEEMVERLMKGNDVSHDAAHVFRVRDLSISLALLENPSLSPSSLLTVELAALLHDIGDYKYVRDPSEEKIVEEFLEAEGVEESMREKILGIITRMGFKEEVTGQASTDFSLEFGVVQDADRLDAIGAIGIARCFTFGGSRNRVLHDPDIKPRTDLSKEQYMQKDKQTTINHFHEKLLKLKDLMKTQVLGASIQRILIYYYEAKKGYYFVQAGRQMAEKRHKFMEDFLKEFYDEWNASV